MAKRKLPPPEATGEIFGLVGFCDEYRTEAGRIVRATQVELLPDSCTYWCREGDTEWTPIPRKEEP